MRLAHWCHAYCGGAWREPLTEHLEVLRGADFDGELHWGAVGPLHEIAEAADLVGQPPDAMAPEGWEQVTLSALHAFAQTHDGAILYSHTKGAADTSDFRAKWRRSMEMRVVDNWRSNLTALEDHDVVGCHWLTPDVWPGTITTPFFGGNYWIARCDYLRRLPECPTTDRFDAERWIGMANPRAFDLLPGWPGEELFAL